MTVSDLKLKIFRKIDNLGKERLQELYGQIENFINSKKNIDDWENLHEQQKQGILDALKEIASGKGIPHSQVMSKIRNKYPDA